MISQQCFSEQGLHAQASSASPNNTDTSTQFSTGFSFREHTQVSSETRASQRPTQTPRSMDRVFMDSLGQHRLFSLYWGYTQVPCKLASMALAQSIGSNGCEPPSWLTASVLFACTKVDTCHPGNCMRSIRTPSSHHLGNHVSF